MTNRRFVVVGLAAAITAAFSKAFAHEYQKPFVLDPLYQPQLVTFPASYAAGTVVVDTANRFLYLVEIAGLARRYGIGVGRAGLAWSGTAEVGRKAKWPSWTPTANMIRREPRKYARYAGGVPGGARNPLGSRALYLYRNGRDTYYRIHGTTEPWTIGKAVSNGCIRMINEHVEDLFERVPIGTAVIVVPASGLVGTVMNQREKAAAPTVADPSESRTHNQ
jgi:lipoprotein-anchoring transpeptidase ErfK/SrfK